MAQKVAAEAPKPAAANPSRAVGPVEAMRVAAAGAPRLIAAPDGPRIAALAYDGFDTDFNEGAAQCYLAQRLAGPDAAFDAIESNLGDAWKDTIVVAITEFGRTARVNGTHGTDHGTATVALLAGGAVAGGRVITDWPSLKSASLYEAAISSDHRPPRRAQGHIGRPIWARAEDAGGVNLSRQRGRSADEGARRVTLVRRRARRADQLSATR
jgi:uncharacterized protein (DUF1501 family)